MTNTRKLLTETTSTDAADNPAVTATNPSASTDPTTTLDPGEAAAQASSSSTTEVNSLGITVETGTTKVLIPFPLGPFLAGAAIVALAALSLGQMLGAPWKAALAAIIVGALVATATAAWSGWSEKAATLEVVTERAERSRDIVEAALSELAPVDRSSLVGILENLDMPANAQPIVGFDSDWMNLRPFEFEWRDIPPTLRHAVQDETPSSWVGEISGEKPG